MEPETVAEPKKKTPKVDINSSDYISAISSKIKAGEKIKGSRRVVVVKASDSVFVYDAVEITEAIIKKKAPLAVRNMGNDDLLKYVFGDMIRSNVEDREDGCLLVTVEGL